MTGSPAFPVLRYLAGQDMLLWTYLPPDQLPLLSGVVRELPELQVVLNHLGFCPQDMQIDEHRRPRFDDAFPESTVQQVLRLSEAGGGPPYGLRPIRPVDAGTSVPRPVPGDPPFRRGIRTRAPAVGFGLPWTRDVPGYRALPDLVPAALPDLDAENLARVLGGTARKLFPHLAGEPSSETTARLP